MSILKQVDILAAGAQPWNTHICAAHGSRFAYAATLAVYIYEYNTMGERFQLHSIMGEHTKTITAITWCPTNTNVIASASTDGTIIVWNIKEQRTEGKVTNAQTPITNIEWRTNMPDTLTFMSRLGPLMCWKYTEGGDVTSLKNTDNFACEVLMFKWNLKDGSKVCYGHEDGSISIYDGKKMHSNVLSTASSMSLEGDSVLSLEWDPLSVDYLLVSAKHSGVRLIDTSSRTVVTHFKLPKTGMEVRKLCWVSSAPGMFLSGDSGNGVLRVWSVGQDTPVVNIPVKDKGFQSLFLMEGEYTKRLTRLSSSVSMCSLTDLKVALPPVSVVMTFKDGGLGVYHLKRRKWMFIREKAHTETIFACEFHPSDPNILATGSFDGSIKVWDIRTMSPLHSSSENLSVIYSLSWKHDLDSYKIYGATKKYGAVLWDVMNETITKNFNNHSNHTTYSCCCSPKDDSYFASVGADNQCIVNISGTRKHYKHPAPVFGCDWSPSNRDLLATGCEDCKVRVFYIPTGTTDPLKVFTGHTKKVFAVKWSPVKDGVLCSGSDDRTIRIWDYVQERCVCCLEGHGSVVRGLLWSPEIPNCLISGSWDATVRVWDTRTGYCIEVAGDHAADVYGLACHPKRPFVVASSSRDSTLRLWTMRGLVEPMYVGLLAGADIEAVRKCNVGLGGMFSSELCGELIKSLQSKRNSGLEEKLQIFSRFLLAPIGVDNFWALVSIIKNGSKAMLPDNYMDMIQHSSHLTKYKSSQGQTLETSANFGKLMGPRKKAEHLREAARIHMSLGDAEKYCEIMLQLGEWEKALAVAPAVSMAYWQSLSQRYAARLSDQEEDEAAVYWMASRDVEGLCNSYLERNQYHEAMLAVQVAVERNFTKQHLECENTEKPVNMYNGNNKDFDQLHIETTAMLADWYFSNGKPVLSACCHLSVDDTDSAVFKLLRGNELELAYSLSQVLPPSDSACLEVARSLSRRCQRYKLWDTALVFLKAVKANEVDIVSLCAQHSGSVAQRDAFHSTAGLPSVSDCTKEAEKYLKQDNHLKSCHYYLVSSEPQKAISIAVEKLKSIFLTDNWTLDELLPFHTVLGCAREQVAKELSEHLLGVVLATTSYVGALLAIRRSYTSVVLPLFQSTLGYMLQSKVDLGLKPAFIQEQLESWLVHNIQNNIEQQQQQYFKQKPTSKQIEVYNNLVSRCSCTCDDAVASGLYGDFVVTGHRFPAHGAARSHVFNGEPVKGPVFLLEDGKTALPQAFALVWASVNPFSMLGTGCHINPF